MDLSDIKQPKLYSMRETAAFMKISYPTLFRMVQSGRIKPLNIAKSGKRPIYAFRAEDVKEYYESIGCDGAPNPDSDSVVAQPE